MPRSQCRRTTSPARAASTCTEQALRDALRPLPPGRDSAQARQQFTEQWVTRALLYEEAQRRGLPGDSAVQQQLRESEQSVLTSALLDRLYEDAAAELRPAAVRAFFDNNKERLRLGEAHVRVRHLVTTRRADAEAARLALQRAALDETDEARWPEIVQRYAPEGARTPPLPQGYFAERRLTARVPEAAPWLERMADGQIAPIFASDSLFHLLQLLGRAPAGAVPQLAWVEVEVRRRLAMQRRKQTVAREVQRLRNEAAARDELDLP